MDGYEAHLSNRIDKQLDRESNAKYQWQRNLARGKRAELERKLKRYQESEWRRRLC